MQSPGSGRLREGAAKVVGSGRTDDGAMSVFKPVLVKPNPDDLNFGEKIAGKINKQALLKELNLFYSHQEIKGGFANIVYLAQLGVTIDNFSFASGYRCYCLYTRRSTRPVLHGCEPPSHRALRVVQ